MPTRLRISVVVLLFVAGLSLAVEGEAGRFEDDWLVRAWQTDEGLPDNNVTGIEQTGDGFLWVSTLGGLIRFDGANFEEFSINHLPKVTNQNVRRSFQDRRGRLWLVLDRMALIRLDDREARVFAAEDGLMDGRVAAMAEDGAGVLWMVFGNSVLRVVEDKIERAGAELDLPGGGVPWVAADRRGQIWLGRGNQLGVIRDGRWRAKLTMEAVPVRFVASRHGGLWISAGEQIYAYTEGEIPVAMGQLPGRASVRDLMEDAQGRLWVGTAADGVLLLENGGFLSLPVSHPEILDLNQDREGNIWIGTAGGGLNLLRPQAVSLISTKRGLTFDSVRSVCEDAEGWVWAALQNGELVRGRGSNWSAMTAKEGWPGGNAFCVTAARDGGVWVGTRDQGLRHWKDGQAKSWRRGDDLGGGWVRAVLDTSKGELWLATEQPGRLCLFDGNGFRRFDVPEGTRSIRALAETTDGRLWAGTSDGRLFRLQGSRIVSEAVAGLDESHSIRCLHATADGSLWIGFAGWGVGRLREGKFSRVDVAQGLFNGYVTQILSDRQDGLWIMSNHGLFRVQYNEIVSVVERQREWLRSIAYGRNEGLPSVQAANECTPTAWRAADGRLWFATRKGLMVVAPEKVHDNPMPPPVKLTRVSVDDRSVALYDSQSPLRAAGESKLVDLAVAPAALELGPGHEKVEFSFAALSFNSPENVHFRHRLHGFDHDWVEAGPQRSAKYPRLPAGQYALQVTACNEAGVWNPEGTTLAIVVSPFFWQTWWFRGGVGLGFTACVVGLVRFFSFRRLRRELAQLERQAELQRERTRIARDMHDEVGTKLSRLSLLSEMARLQPQLPPAAQSEVAEISETAREAIRSFEEIVWAVNPKNDSLANLVHYFCRFAEDLFEGSGTQCVFDLPDEIPAMALSTETRHHVFLAAKEALNNILKHAHARTVAVRLRLVAGGFGLEIEDDGVGFDLAAVPARAGGGNGLENLRERMRMANGEIELQSAPGKGTCLRFRVTGATTQPV